MGWAPALAVRISFTGELGWELYVPVESLPALYDQLVEAGEPLGLRHAGYHALDGLRAEKGYIHWGADVGPADTPYEAGLAMTVAMDKPGGFVGREALAAAGPPRRRLVPILLADPEPLLYHGESVLHDGRVVGRVTSGGLRPHAGRGRRAGRPRGRPREVDEVLAAGDGGGRDRRPPRGRPASRPGPSTIPRAAACAEAEPPGAGGRRAGRPARLSPLPAAARKMAAWSRRARHQRPSRKDALVTGLYVVAGVLVLLVVAVTSGLADVSEAAADAAGVPAAASSRVPVSVRLPERDEPHDHGHA